MQSAQRIAWLESDDDC